MERREKRWTLLDVPVAATRRLSLPNFRVPRVLGKPTTPKSSRRRRRSQSPETPRDASPQRTPSPDSFDIVVIDEDGADDLFGDDDAEQSSSSLLAKSAPTTPQAELLQPTAPKSPSHVFGRNDRQALKQLSASVPAMTQAPLRPPADPPGSSKSRQKKFHRHFKNVAAEEHVLNYYSCALVGDILLQGHLYITKNYFAFYSNVFGYVTKLLIPTGSVLKISKEKTARIIPNAVGVTTEDEKHVFGSLLSRDATYRLMMQVWKAAINAGPQSALPIEKDEIDSASADIPDDEDSSQSGSEPSCPPTPIECVDVSHSESCPAKLPNGNILPGVKHIKVNPVKTTNVTSEIMRPNVILIVSTVLLVMLFFSAAYLLYRIGRIQNQFVENPLLTSSDEVYQEILKWQTQLHTRSANEVQEFLNTNLNQLARVRQSLEALSLLIVSEEGNEAVKKPQDKKLNERNQQPAPSFAQDRHS